MENDLTPFEKNLLKTLNLKNSTRYTKENLMEWGSDKKLIENHLEDGEKIFKALGVYVTIKV